MPSGAPPGTPGEPGVGSPVAGLPEVSARAAADDGFPTDTVATGEGAPVTGPVGDTGAAAVLTAALVPAPAAALAAAGTVGVDGTEGSAGSDVDPLPVAAPVDSGPVAGCAVAAGALPNGARVEGRAVTAPVGTAVSTPTGVTSEFASDAVARTPDRAGFTACNGDASPAADTADSNGVVTVATAGVATTWPTRPAAFTTVVGTEVANEDTNGVTPGTAEDSVEVALGIADDRVEVALGMAEDRVDVVPITAEGSPAYCVSGGTAVETIVDPADVTGAKSGGNAD